MAAADLSLELYRRTLFQPYLIHTARNSSEIIAGISDKVSHSITYLHQTSNMLSSIIILMFLISTLVAINPQAALASGLSFGSAYLFITFFVRKRLQRNGEVLSSEAPRILKALQEGLAGIRDVLLDGTQDYYCDLYADSNKKIRRAQSENTFMNLAPRHIMEGFGIVFIALLAYWLTVGKNMGQQALPVLGALALGAQRMLPALQAVYGAWASITASEPSVSDSLVLLDQRIPLGSGSPIGKPLGLKKVISFEAVEFEYSSTNAFKLEKINLKIKKGEHIGIIGSTGSGKSTVLDILMGLLQPSKGHLVVDGIPIDEKMSLQWRQSIAHVPQSIFLADASIAENIALGNNMEDIDMTQVRLAARQAQIADLIDSRADGYLTRVGERGLKLSGGQRQRIAIARALYKNVPVLVLDEATSALDNDTEREVMNAVHVLNPNLTIITVAHRIASVQGCSRIIKIEDGSIVAEGSFKDMVNYDNYDRGGT
jgi:ATP-binding cassette subfamily B protein